MRRDPVFIVVGFLFAGLAAAFGVILLSRRDEECTPLPPGTGTDESCGQGLLWTTEAVLGAVGMTIFASLALAALFFGARRRG